MNKWLRFALNALGLTLSLSGSAFAQLAAVDPGPYTFATGKFLMWYQDTISCRWNCTSPAPQFPGTGQRATGLHVHPAADAGRVRRRPAHGVPG